MVRFRSPFQFLGLFLAALSPAVALADGKPLRAVIDSEVRAAWKREGITPAPKADDAAFQRRLYLDLIGRVPTYEEATSFLSETEPKKRDNLITRLLDHPRFAVQQADVWDLVLFGRHPANGDATRKRDGFKKWLAGKFASGEPYDRWVRDLVLAEQEGPELFHVQFRNQPEEATVAVTRVFLGTQLQCARCHDHPFESWTQRDFYGMAGFFVRLVVLDAGGSGANKRYAIGEKGAGEVLFSGSAKEQRPGRKGDPVRPKFLGGPELDEPPTPKGYKDPAPKGGKLPKPAFSRKARFADWLVGPENPYFARAVANRVWAQFMGRGLVHPVDDLGSKNAPSHPELLTKIADGLKANRFDLKWLIRELVSSETYQLGATGPRTEALPPWFERARVRPLTAEELLSAIRVATGHDDGNPEAKFGNATVEYFVRYFGEPTNGLGDFQGSLTEHLFLNNAEQVRQFFRRKKGNLADTLLASTEPWEKRVDRLFLSMLGRPPKPNERERFVRHLSSDPKKPEPLVEDAIWVLINSSEFRFNH